MRLLPLVALCTLIGYAAAFLAPCPQAMPATASAAVEQHAHEVPAPDPHAGHGHGGHPMQMAGSPPPAPSPPDCEIDALCPCGCETAPKARTGTARIPIGITSAVPALPAAPELVPCLEANAALPRTPFAPIDHVPIPV